VGERTHVTDMLITLCRELVLSGKPFFVEGHSVQKKLLHLFLASACGKMYNRRTYLSEECQLKSTWELFFISTKKTLLNYRSFGLSFASDAHYIHNINLG
jgi:hypothetical protein